MLWSFKSESDKGKPGENRGRKAMGLRPPASGYGCQAADEKTLPLSLRGPVVRPVSFLSVIGSAPFAQEPEQFSTGIRGGLPRRFAGVKRTTISVD